MSNNPTNQAINSSLVIMELNLQDMFSNVQTALEDLANNKRDAAMGALLQSSDQFAALKTLYDSTLIYHRQAALLEGPEV